MTTITVYQHPDGFELTVGNGQLTACADGIVVAMPLNLEELATIADELLAYVGNQSEQLGHDAAVDYINALLDISDTPNERIKAIQDAINTLQSAAHPKRAIAGFDALLGRVRDLLGAA